MTFQSEVYKSFDNLINNYGERVRFKYYTVGYGAGSYYDDDVTLTQYGSDLWISGIVQPINSTSNSQEALLLEQGKILLDDKKLYVNGSANTSGLGPIKIGMAGSPPTNEYQILGDGQVIEWSITGSPVYKKVYIRALNSGSFIGE